MKKEAARKYFKRLLAATLSAAVLSQPLFAVAATTINASGITPNSGGGYVLTGDTVIVMDGNQTLVYISGDAYSLTISGSGTLTLNNSGGDSILVKSLVVENATVIAEGRIHAISDLTIDSGTVSVDGGSREGIYAATTTAGGTPIAGGTITINGGTVTAKGEDGIFVGKDGTMTINGGTVNAKGDDSGILVGENGTLTVNGGTVTSEGNDWHGIAADTIIINDGTVTAKTNDAIGIGAFTSATFNGGTTTAEGSLAAVYAVESIVLSGGTNIITPAGGSVMNYDDGVDTASVIMNQDGTTPATRAVIQGSTTSASSGNAKSGVHTHNHVWVMEKEATETEDALYLYRCACGDVAGRSRVPNSAFYRFNVNSANKIAKAAPGSTVVIDARPGNWNAFHEMVYTAMRDRNDVTVQIEYRDHGELYTLIIPAGSDLEALPGGSTYVEEKDANGCAGYLFLAQAASVEPKPFAPWED